jgi:hypothetical protein
MSTKFLLRCVTAVILFIGLYLNSVLIMATGGGIFIATAFIKFGD